MTGRLARRASAVLVGVVVLGLAGCSSSKTGSSTTLPPQPAGVHPSSISKMVCSSDAQHKVAVTLGVTATVAPPTWSDHVYQCRFAYPQGSMTLSVKELSSWSETLAYFHGLGDRLGDTGAVSGLGQGAFNTTDGSVVVRKDWKVLLVDVSQLPAQFGSPPTSASAVAYTVADLVMACWAGD